MKKCKINIGFILLIFLCSNFNVNVFAKETSCNIILNINEKSSQQESTKLKDCGNSYLIAEKNKQKFNYYLHIKGFSKEVTNNNNYKMTHKDTGKTYNIHVQIKPTEKWYLKIKNKLDNNMSITDLESDMYQKYISIQENNSSYYAQLNKIKNENNEESDETIENISVNTMKKMFKNKDLSFEKDENNDGMYYVYYYDDKKNYIKKQITYNVAVEIGAIKDKSIEKSKKELEKKYLSEKELAQQTKEVKKTINFSKTELLFIGLISLLLILLIVVIIFEKKSKKIKES